MIGFRFGIGLWGCPLPARRRAKRFVLGQRCADKSRLVLAQSHCRDWRIKTARHALLNAFARVPGNSPSATTGGLVKRRTRGS